MNHIKYIRLIIFGATPEFFHHELILAFAFINEDISMKANEAKQALKIVVIAIECKLMLEKQVYEIK